MDEIKKKMAPVSMLLLVSMTSAFIASLRKNGGFLKANKYRGIAWTHLTENEKRTLVHEWSDAGIAVETLEDTGRKAVVITFFTSEDTFLGPIIIYIDADTERIIGREVRE
ncbi:MAG: hypothetical protein ABIJ16_04570 [Bacteroidota bacterium]